MRLDPKDMESLGINTGETVRVIGKRATVAPQNIVGGVHRAISIVIAEHAARHVAYFLS